MFWAILFWPVTIILILIGTVIFFTIVSVEKHTSPKFEDASEENRRAFELEEMELANRLRRQVVSEFPEADGCSIYIAQQGFITIMQSGQRVRVKFKDAQDVVHNLEYKYRNGEFTLTDDFTIRRTNPTGDTDNKKLDSFIEEVNRLNADAVKESKPEFELSQELIDSVGEHAAFEALENLGYNVSKVNDAVRCRTFFDDEYEI